MNEEYFVRHCSVCGKEMYEGYCVFNGEEYYCSTKCLNEDYTDDEWEQLHYSNSDCYWTEWEDSFVGLSDMEWEDIDE